MTVQLRPAIASDEPAISELLVAAFGDEEGPEIAQLVADLHRDPSAQPTRSLVAVVEQATGDAIVGHVLLTPVRLDSGRQTASAAILAPLSVRPDRQRQGIGSQLVTAGFEQVRAGGGDLVFVLGDPNYYRRFGFTPASSEGFTAPHPLPPEYADAWMVAELRPGAIAGTSGRVTCADALNDPKHWL